MPTVAMYVPAIMWREFRALVDPNHEWDDRVIESQLREVLRVGLQEWLDERKAISR